MGPAANTSSGETRLGLSATAAAAVLYGAVVLFGLGPASPLALDRNGDLPAPVVQVPHDTAAPGPELRGPQPSPGPTRPQSQRQLRTSKNPAAPKSALTTQTPVKPVAQPRPAASTPQQPSVSSTASAPLVILPDPELPITIPPIELSDPASILPPLPPPPALPPAPALPAIPPLPLP